MVSLKKTSTWLTDNPAKNHNQYSYFASSYLVIMHKVHLKVKVFCIITFNAWTPTKEHALLELISFWQAYTMQTHLS